MAKEKKNPKASSKEEMLAKRVKQQETIVAELAETFEKKHSEELELKLNRERDTLRHLNLVQKRNVKERAETKSLYAAKAALSRAVQPIE